MKKQKSTHGEIRVGGHVGKRHVRGKAGRVGRPVPSPALKQRSSGKLSVKAAHANRVAQSNASRTVGVRSIQRMVDTGKRTPDFRHRGLDREDPTHPGTIARAARREAKREAHRNSVKNAAAFAHSEARRGR